MKEINMYEAIYKSALEDNARLRDEIATLKKQLEDTLAALKRINEELKRPSVLLQRQAN
jgi:hypothetical protein